MKEKINFETQILINKAKLGDEEARNKLFYRYRPRVLRVVRLRLLRLNPHLRETLRSKLQSEDIVQEALLIAHKKLKDFEFEEEGDFIHWLSGIVKNCIQDKIDYYFAQKRHPLAEEISIEEIIKTDSESEVNLIEAIPSKETSPTQFVRKQEIKDVFDNLILKLEDEISQEIIIQHLLEQRTFNKIAQDLNMNEDAVRKRFHRAYQKLITLIEDNPVFKEYKNGRI
jgi:RNA polymerase sigma-70 factor (subfamily 1)